MSTKTLRLAAFDTLFFRESRPFDAIGGSELASVFPPPPRTLLGALRAVVGDSLTVDWQAFGKHKNNYLLPDGKRLSDLIGYGDDLANLSVNGVWLSWNGERLYPAPLFLLRKGEGKGSRMERLRIGSPLQTPLGKVRLPEIPGKESGFRSLDGAWLSRSGLGKVLSGELPGEEEFYQRRDMFVDELRLGIARDNHKRTVETGLLYQTLHIRPRPDLAMEMDVSGLADDLCINNHVVRLGGEGRMATMAEITGGPVELPTPVVREDTKGVILILLTPARFKAERGEPGWLPDGFKENPDPSGIRRWTGEIKEIPLTLHAAVIGKAQREGGWDMAERRPRVVQSLIPPGSCYYCTVNEGKIEDAIDAVRGAYIGEDNALGRGLIACALWNHREFSIECKGGEV